jgi:hypothetical protein
VAHSGPCGCAEKLPSDQVARECGLRNWWAEGKDARNLGCSLVFQRGLVEYAKNPDFPLTLCVCNSYCKIEDKHTYYHETCLASFLTVSSVRHYQRACISLTYLYYQTRNEIIALKLSCPSIEGGRLSIIVTVRACPVPSVMATNGGVVVHRDPPTTNPVSQIPLVLRYPQLILGICSPITRRL